MVLGESAADIELGSVTESVWQNRPVTVLRATHTAAEGFDLLVSNIHAAPLWQALIATGARPVGYEALEILRVEAGIPRYPQDMDDTTVVTETSLDDAVSYTKGCYVGQEIIARIKYRGHVAKKLRGLIFERPTKIAAGAAIKSTDGKEIGHVTSSVFSPHLGRRVALGYVKYDYVAAGTEVKTGDGAPTEIVDLPFMN
jgi:folate-binding protein YgfZ